MNEITNSELHLFAADELFYEITSEEVELTVGGATVIPLWRGGPEIQLSTFHDGVNNSKTETHSPFGLYDNKFFTVDLSRISIYLVV